MTHPRLVVESSSKMPASAMLLCHRPLEVKWAVRSQEVISSPDWWDRTSFKAKDSRSEVFMVTCSSVSLLGVWRWQDDVKYSLECSREGFPHLTGPLVIFLNHCAAGSIYSSLVHVNLWWCDGLRADKV